MLPTEILKNEHQLILMVLDAAEREAALIANGGRVDAARLEQIVDFVRQFADRCHHAKEEDLLFVRMGEKGFPVDGGPVGVMLHEHEVSRSYVATLADSIAAAAGGEARARARVTESLAAYAALLRQHISKEDNILYPMADRVFSDADQQALAADFERVERERFGEDVHERYRALARELASR